MWVEGYALAVFSVLPGTCPLPPSHPAPEMCLPPAWWDSVISSELTHWWLWADRRMTVGTEWWTAERAAQGRRTEEEGERDAEGWEEMMDSSPHPRATEHLLRTRHWTRRWVCSGHSCCLPSIWEPLFLLGTALTLLRCLTLFHTHSLEEAASSPQLQT